MYYLFFLATVLAVTCFNTPTSAMLRQTFECPSANVVKADIRNGKEFIQNEWKILNGEDVHSDETLIPSYACIGCYYHGAYGAQCAYKIKNSQNKVIKIGAIVNWEYFSFNFRAPQDSQGGTYCYVSEEEASNASTFPERCIFQYALSLSHFKERPRKHF